MNVCSFTALCWKKNEFKGVRTSIIIVVSSQLLFYSRLTDAQHIAVNILKVRRWFRCGAVPATIAKLMLAFFLAHFSAGYNRLQKMFTIYEEKIYRIETHRLRKLFLEFSQLAENLPQIHADYVHTFDAVHLTSAMHFYRCPHDYDVSMHLDRIAPHFVTHVSPSPCKTKPKEWEKFSAHKMKTK